MDFRKQNPNRWYLVMLFCIIFSYIVFTVGPRIGYETHTAHEVALLIGMWAPTIGLLGVRAETLKKLESKQEQQQ